MGKDAVVKRVWVLVTVLCALVPACGGPDAPTSLGSSGSIRRAAETTLATGSAAFEQRVTFEGSPLEADIVGTGAVEFGVPRQMQGSFEVPGVGTFELIVDDTTLYLGGSLAADLVGDERSWVKVDLGSDDPRVRDLQDLATGQNDASLLLYYLYGAIGELEAIGSRSIGGVEATGYHVTVDLETALAKVPSEAKEALRLNIEEIRGSGVMPELDAEVWIDEDGLVRRTVYEYVGVDQLGGGTARAVSDLSAFGEPVELAIPEPDQVVSIEDLG
jgi:hypothetical protein